MKQTWRWFGPSDNTSITDARQAGADGIVSALHHIPTGDVWTVTEIQKRKKEIEYTTDGKPTGLTWDVVESLPVSEAMKTRTGDLKKLFANYRISMENLAKQGLKTICYNFMPVLDWTRTDLSYNLDNGARAMYFDIIDFAAFDLFILCRKNIGDDYPVDIIEQARLRYDGMSEEKKTKLSQNVTAGLPGSEESWSLEDLSSKLAEYQQISAKQLHKNHIAFLNEILPTAERLGMRFCCHPDDPPFPLLGLPRIMSTADDYRRLFKDVPSPSVGMTFCAGSLGARHDNDLPAMAKEFAPHIFFAHLRNVRRESEQVPCSFYEDEHLAGQTDMVALVKVLMEEELCRTAEGREDHQIFMRPDHGHDILDDLKRSTQPGYPSVGRLKGLAEIRGVMSAIASLNKL